MGFENVLKPRSVEQVAPCALGRLAIQKGLGQHVVQQVWQHDAGGCPSSTIVVMLPSMAVTPAVHQCIARAAVESQHGVLRARVQQCQVGDTADVQYRQSFAMGAEERLVKRWHQWSALSACCDVPTAKVRHYVHAAQLCQKVPVDSAGWCNRCHRIRQAGVEPSGHVLRWHERRTGAARSLAATCQPPSHTSGPAHWLPMRHDEFRRCRRR